VQEVLFLGGLAQYHRDLRLCSFSWLKP